MPQANRIQIGILTVSDRASKGSYQDISGKEIISLLKKYLAVDWLPVYKIIPDNLGQIKSTLKRMADKEKCCLIITTGGTGPALRDITPEVTAQVCSKILPGFGEAMRIVSLKSVPTAILSRQTAGIRNQTLIINLPGNPKAIKQCLTAVLPAVPDCIDLIGGPYLKYRSGTLRTLHLHR
ncbi:MAG TPA: molybdopterin adenylyltransferase [Candidatus Omnitrophota bacterium]|nr:molybdopterin adenylyltransferase [Candidatus Omnitrophota bacterium]HPD85380.1 molybdopterin adenylyltransferase [Candidatus Omnitrophota bacterium]HRZ04119.1 molybdopterin adenylyltransferase [Candidatus Omnitrophota bacterium]